MPFCYKLLRAFVLLSQMMTLRDVSCKQEIGPIEAMLWINELKSELVGSKTIGELFQAPVSEPRNKDIIQSTLEQLRRHTDR